MSLIKSIKQTNSFKRAVKKFPKQHKLAIDDQIQTIKENPEIGVQKKGDLSFLRVHKFDINKQEVLLGYSYIDGSITITLIHLAPHENFYRDVKRMDWS